MNARGEKKYTIVDAVLEERTQALENGVVSEKVCKLLFAS